MRRLIEATFVSLDGVIESQEKWALPYFSGESKSEALAELASVDTLLLGRESYQKFSATWSQVKGDPYFDHINGLRKLVASRTLASAIWNAEIIKGEVADEIARLKRQPGKNIIKYGTGDLDRALIEHNLIDEFEILDLPRRRRAWPTSLRRYRSRQSKARAHRDEELQQRRGANDLRAKIERRIVLHLQDPVYLGCVSCDSVESSCVDHLRVQRGRGIGSERIPIVTDRRPGTRDEAAEPCLCCGARVSCWPEAEVPQGVRLGRYREKPT